ncbi:MAG TPA: hypothetical protein VFE82_00275 [Ramlibacter sp.]|jgi:hypothetical protein|uniref:hypothetical protein n=1 Tax=Ramlibacter sp. TaxID=1917967 RepID=UPI002D45189D|nr:hypothetical protein [Ramlibacter sp.]HZY16879.1 hypothetical protein [Ramlibacter sp.]
MNEHFARTLPSPDPEVKPPEYRVPRGRSGVGALSALDQLLKDAERIRRAKEYYGDWSPARIQLLG